MPLKAARQGQMFEDVRIILLCLWFYFKPWYIPRMIRFSLYTAGQAAKITGVSSDLQRDWRRRGILPAVEGHVRYDPLGLCRLMVLKELSKLQLRVSTSEDELEFLSNSVLFHALSFLKSYSGDIDHYAPPLEYLWMGVIRYSGIGSESAIDIWKSWPLRDSIVDNDYVCKSDHVAVDLDDKFIPTEFFDDDSNSSKSSNIRFGFSVPLIRLKAMGIHLSNFGSPLCSLSLDKEDYSSNPLSDLHDLDALFKAAQEEYEKLAETTVDFYEYENYPVSFD